MVLRAEIQLLFIEDNYYGNGYSRNMPETYK